MGYSFCKKCGARLENGVCTQCGAQYSQPQYEKPQPQYVGVQPQYGAPQPQYGHQANNALVEPDERVIATIGNSYAANFFTSGFLEAGSAMLTNKRFYYNGKAISPGSMIMKKTKCVVELSEITGVEIVHTVNKKKLLIIFFILEVLCVIITIAGCVLGVNATIFVYFAIIVAFVTGIASILVKDYLCVVFRDGSVTFPIGLYGFAKCNEFLCQILLARKAFLGNP